MPVVDRYKRNFAFIKDRFVYKNFLEEAKRYKFSSIDKETIKSLARKFGIPYSEAFSIVSFYSLLNVNGKNLLSCNAPCCINNETFDNAIKTHCLGLCDNSSAVIKEGKQASFVRGIFKETETAKVLNKNIDDCFILKVRDKEEYITTLTKLLSADRDELLEIVKKSDLKGRGGANFPTYKKFEAIKNINSSKKYLVCNIDESEPFVFKDRALIEINPFVAVAGVILSAYIVGATDIIFYIRGEYIKQKKILSEITSYFLSEIDFFNSLNVEIVAGAGAYVCGEETGLIESFEGKRGNPRNKPPYPFEAGIFGKPTLVNNIETLSYVFEVCDKKIVNLNKKLISICGDVKEKGVVEIDLDVTLNEIIKNFCEGIIGNPSFAVLGGASGFFVDKKDFNKKLKDFEKSFVGSIFIANESRDKLSILRYFVSFFADESCGQCIPCYKGYQKLEEILTSNNLNDKVEDIKSIVESMSVSTRCGLGKAIKNGVYSFFESAK